jgi:hypothetical protein
MFEIAGRAVERHGPIGINLLRFHFRFHCLGARLAAVDCKQPSDLVPSSHVQVVELPYLGFAPFRGVAKSTIALSPPAEF